MQPHASQLVRAFSGSDDLTSHLRAIFEHLLAARLIIIYDKGGSLGPHSICRQIPHQPDPAHAISLRFAWQHESLSTGQTSGKLQLCRTWQRWRLSDVSAGPGIKPRNKLLAASMDFMLLWKAIWHKLPSSWLRDAQAGIECLAGDVHCSLGGGSAQLRAPCSHVTDLTGSGACAAVLQLSAHDDCAEAAAGA